MAARIRVCRCLDRQAQIDKRSRSSPASGKGRLPRCHCIRGPAGAEERTQRAAGLRRHRASTLPAGGGAMDPLSSTGARAVRRLSSNECVENDPLRGACRAGAPRRSRRRAVCGPRRGATRRWQTCATRIVGAVAHSANTSEPRRSPGDCVDACRCAPDLHAVVLCRRAAGSTALASGLGSRVSMRRPAALPGPPGGRRTRASNGSAFCCGIRSTGKKTSS